MQESDCKIIKWNSRIASVGPAACAIGAFDGVHRGHRFLIGSMIDEAHKKGISSVIVTFDIDPDELFKQRADVCKILSNEDRLDMLAGLGADYVLDVPFSRAMAARDYKDFLENVLWPFMDLDSIHVGHDFSFGSGAQGHVDNIRAWGKANGCTCKGYKLLRINGHPVTATRIRQLLATGDVCNASALLGRDHYVRGIVAHGRGAGRSLGFPTANVVPVVPYTPLQDGVYAGYVTVDGKRFPSAISVGHPPSFKAATGKLEAYLIGFDGNLYDQEVSVSFACRLRDMMEFEDIDELVSTVNANIDWVREHLA